ncbi:MAG: HEAT repeat domain-containing protein [bacterium]
MKTRLSKGIACLITLGLLAGLGLAEKKPAQEPAQVENPQPLVQPKVVGTESESVEATEERGEMNISKKCTCEKFIVSLDTREEICKKIPQLIKQLNCPRSFHRERAIILLSRSGDPRAVKPLIDAMLNDRDEGLRAFATVGLRNLASDVDKNLALKEAFEKDGIPVLNEVSKEETKIQVNNKPIDVYDFPIKPGTEEWKALGSTENRIKACQIPEDILKKMSTEGLIETCLGYPGLPNMFLSNNPQTGFDSIVRTFNGLQELLRRKDAGTKLLARYRQIRKLDRQSIQKELGKLGTLYFRCFEMLISQDVILSKMTKEERIELLRESIWKFNEKQKYDLYSSASKDKEGKRRVRSPETLLIMGRILQKEKFEPFILKTQNKESLRIFFENPHLYGSKLIDEIIPEAEKFLKEQEKRKRKIMDVYDFPIKPGTEEWKALGSTKKRVEACQIPADILKKMSTEGLIETCLRYPGLPNMFLSSNPQIGFNSIVRTFNGLQELLGRKDAGTKLLARYRQIRKLDRQSIQKELGEYGTLYFRCFEVLISQDAILSKMSKEERVELLRECIWKFYEKEKFLDVYGYVSPEGKRRAISPETLLIIGRILQKEEFKPFKLKIQEKEFLRIFLERVSWDGERIIDEIIPDAERFLKNKQEEGNK